MEHVSLAALRVPTIESPAFLSVVFRGSAADAGEFHLSLSFQVWKLGPRRAPSDYAVTSELLETSEAIFSVRVHSALFSREDSLMPVTARVRRREA